MGLKKYNEKRDFDKTSEPKGDKAGEPKAGKAKREKSGRLRFVVQHHIASREHYDFRLERNGVMLSWAVPKGASFDPKDKRLSVRVEDHPIEYNDFEGTIPKGQYGGGTVMIWDEGYYEMQKENTDEENSLKFVLYGSRLKGKWALVRMKNAGDKSNNWLLIKESDEFAQNEEGISEFRTSIRTGRTMDEIERGKTKTQNIAVEKNPFNSVRVQLAASVSALPENGEWIYELKYDGYRIVAYAENGKVTLRSRNGKDYTGYFPNAVRGVKELAAGRAIVLDGEMVALNKGGRSDFSALQSYIKNTGDARLQYVVFDILALSGEDLRSQTLLSRKARLEKLMENAPESLHYSRHSDKLSGDMFDQICEQNFEGIIAKKSDSVYSGNRNGDWIKLKCIIRQEFIICGYSVSAKKTFGISSLILGVYEGAELRHVGRVGSGLSEATQKDLLTKLRKIPRQSPPFTDSTGEPHKVSIRTNNRLTIDVTRSQRGEALHWVEPRLACEVKFAEWTKDGLLRQASYKGLRADKNISEIVRENPEQGDAVTEKSNSAIAEKIKEAAAEKAITNKPNSAVVYGVNISSPSKQVYTNPKLTKLQVAEYYGKVAERMMEHIGGRILSLICCPSGIEKSCHFRKHLTEIPKGVRRVDVDSKPDAKGDYFCITDPIGIINLAQLNAIEFHIWGCSAENPEKPNMMVFDLDPDEGTDIDVVRQGATDLKNILSELSLTSHLKASGGKGYHIVVPYSASSWDEFRLLSKNVAEIMEQKWHNKYTANMRKINRKGKIFIDWVRNGRGATSIAPYSLRARDKARISMPLSWDELYSVRPDDITIPLALSRLSVPDPWSDFPR